MVSNYIDNKCKYDLNRLVNVVYLISEDAVKDIRIDNGDAYIASISQSPIEIKCYGIKLTEDETFDERYKFTHKLTFSVDGYSNHNDLQDRYYVIVKDEDGTYWMLNPLFPCKVTYTYNLGYNEDHTDFTLATVSNHPMLEVRNFTVADVYECKAYWIGGIDKLWLNEKRYTVHSGNSIKYTNDGFKKVDFKKTSPLFTETFNGDNISHAIKFNIGFDNYKTSWHYNLLEFIDNTYASVIKTKNNEYTLCGFSYGMQPSCTINADDTLGNTNHIEITLTDSHDVGDTLDFYDSATYEYLDAKTWEYTKEHNGYECVSEGFAKYLLMKQVDALGNETNKYMCLEGYEQQFADLDIIDTFDDVVLFSSIECGGMECMIDSSIPSTVVFNSTNCKTFYLKSDTPWTATSSSNYITISPSTGAANVEYDVRICNSLIPTATANTSTITVNYCNSAMTYNVSVVENDDCLPQGRTYNISANAQTLTIPTNCCVKSVRETIGVGSIINVYSNSVTVQVPENNTGSNRTISLLAVYCNGKSANIIINQSNVFERWVDDGTSASTVCIGYDEYRREWKYTGQTSSSITAKTDEYRDVFVRRNSPNCGYVEPIYRWFDLDGDEFICSGTTKYHKAKKQVSYDNGSTWQDVVPIEYGTGTMWEEQSEDCGYIPPQYRYTSGSPYCVSYDKYVDVTTEVSYDSGVTWEYVSTTPTLSEVDSTFCGVSYRWQPSGTTCVGYDKWEQSVKQKSYDGASWINVTPLTTTATTLIERNSEDCGYSPNSRWVRTSETVCEMDYKVKIVDNNTHEVSYVPINGSSALTQNEVWSNIESGGTYNIFIGSVVKTVDDKCFMDNSFEKGVELNINIPSTVTKLEYRAFTVWANNTTRFNFIDLTNVEEPKQEARYGDAGAQIFQSTTIKSIGGVGSGAELQIPSHWTGLTKSIFCAVKGLKELEIPSYIKRVDDYAFSYRAGAGAGDYSLGNLSKFVLNEGLEYIGINAFDGLCSGKITIPNSVTYIDSHAFDNLSIKGTYYPNYYIREIEEITVGSGCTFIGYCAFVSCILESDGNWGYTIFKDTLEKLTILATTPPALTKGGIFISDFYPSYISLSDLKVKIYVPSGSVNAYKTNQYWSKYADIIYPI